MKELYKFLIIASVGLFSIILLWLPFFFRLENFWGIKLPKDGMATVIANFDGPYYIAVAKSLYNPAELDKFQFPLAREYYAAHFPGFPLLIKALSPVFGYPWAMMVVTLLSSILALWFFYLLAREVVPKHALWLTIIFAVFPARWLIVRSIGSPEPLFLATILASFYFFQKGNYWAMGIAGALAMFTKSPGILLFAALFLATIHEHFRELALVPKIALKKLLPKILPLAFIPFGLFAVFFLYSRTYGDFFAYFHSGDNIHLMFPPFQVFNKDAVWVGTFWLEEIIWIYLLGFLGIFQLIKRGFLPFAWFVGIFFLSTIFVSHRDIARYILPTVPFLLIAYSDILVTKPFRWALLFLIPPIYLFAINFIIGNATPVADWGPLL